MFKRLFCFHYELLILLLPVCLPTAWTVQEFFESRNDFAVTEMFILGSAVNFTVLHLLISIS